MFTIIFLNEQASEQIRDYQFLFHPLIERDEIAFCNWNEYGSDLSSSTPELQQLLRGKHEWRAIVINIHSLYNSTLSEVRRNPFDFTDIDTNPKPHVSPIPLIRLSHLLGGYPDEPHNEFDPGYEYFNDETGEFVRIPTSELTDEDLDDIIERFGQVKDVYIEKKIPPEDAQTYETINEIFHFTEARPREILLVATRQKSDKTEKARLLATCHPYLETSSSNFWKTNRYPNACRFLVFDVSRSDCSQYQPELVKFWLSILMLAANEVSPGTIQAYRLYHLDIVLDLKTLNRQITRHNALLNASTEFLQKKIEELPSFSFKTDEQLLSREVVPLVIEAADDGENYEGESEFEEGQNTGSEGFGAYDSHIQKKKNEILNDIKNPRRSIDRAARMLRAKSLGFQGESYELDQFQLDDLNDEINALEIKLIQERPCNNFKENKEAMITCIQETNDALSNIPKSMSLEVEIKAALAAILVVLFSNIAYLYNAWGNACFKSAIAATIVQIVIVCAGGFIALQMLKPQMKKKINETIDPMRKVKDNLLNTNASFEDYFSDVCTLMKGRAIQAGTSVCDETSSSEKKRLAQHKTAIQAALARNEHWLEYFNLEPESLPEEEINGAFNTDISPFNNELYYFGSNPEQECAMLNTSGELLNTPYAFIRTLTIEREEIFDDIRETH